MPDIVSVFNSDAVALLDLFREQEIIGSFYNYNIDLRRVNELPYISGLSSGEPFASAFSQVIIPGTDTVLHEHLGGYQAEGASAKRERHL